MTANITNHWTRGFQHFLFRFPKCRPRQFNRYVFRVGNDWNSDDGTFEEFFAALWLSSSVNSTHEEEQDLYFLDCCFLLKVSGNLFSRKGVFRTRKEKARYFQVARQAKVFLDTSCADGLDSSRRKRTARWKLKLRGSERREGNEARYQPFF